MRTPVLATLTFAALQALASPALAQCRIPDSPCYPWRIEAGAAETVLLEIVPSNVPTAALYRVCVCPPAKGVALVFDFEGKQVPIGAVETGSGETLCRDYRLQTARKSRLLLKRTTDASDKVEGCYTTQ